MSSDDDNVHPGQGVANANQKVRPVITPEVFSGEPTASWDEWIGHFESVARINGWDNATRLLWLEVRMTGKAQSAWRRLTNEVKAHYETAKAALRKRFEPESKRELYAVEFQTRKRRHGEPWEELGDSLRLLADKAFPELEDKAREQLSLDRYLSMLEKPDIALAVRQKRPKSIDEAVSYTLEIETYVSTLQAGHHVSSAQETDRPDVENKATINTAQAKEDAILEMLRTLTTRLDRLEMKSEPSEARPRRAGGGQYRKEANRDPIVCRKCGKEGHFARGCAAYRSGN